MWESQDNLKLAIAMSKQILKVDSTIRTQLMMNIVWQYFKTDPTGERIKFNNIIHNYFKKKITFNLEKNCCSMSVSLLN